MKCMARAQCSACNARLSGSIARGSYTYCDWCISRVLRWLHDRDLLARNPFAVAFGFLAHNRAIVSRKGFDIYIAGDSAQPGEYVGGIPWPESGDYSYESVRAMLQDT